MKPSKPRPKGANMKFEEFKELFQQNIRDQNQQTRWRLLDYLKNEKKSTSNEEIIIARQWAFQHTRAHAEKGGAYAQTWVAKLFDEGWGVSKDEKQAFLWAEKSALQKCRWGQNTLGTHYATGQGVAKNSSQAVYWYKKAAEQGHAYAQSNLGSRYALGMGVPKDFNQAVYWLGKAAMQGIASAQSKLGLCYQNGRGVSIDISQAIYWYIRAEKGGNTNATDNLQSLAGQGHAGEIQHQRLQLDIFQALIIFFKALCAPFPSMMTDKFSKNSSARSRIFIISLRK